MGEDFLTWCNDHWRRMIRRRSVQAAQTFEINKFNVTDVFAAHLRIIDLEQSPGASRRTTPDLERRIQIAIESLPCNLVAGGGPTPGRVGNPIVNQLGRAASAGDAGRTVGNKPGRSTDRRETPA